MLGIASRSRRSRSHGSSWRKRIDDVERRAAPHLQAVKIVQLVRNEVGDGQHVVSAHTRGQQRLMGVAESRIGEQQPLLPGRPIGEAFGAQFAEQLAGAVGRVGRVVRRHGRSAYARGHWLAGHLRIAVDDHVRQVTQQLGGAVLARRELEEFGSFVDQARGDVARLEIRVVDHVLKKRNIGLDTANAELAQRAVHTLAGMRKLASPGRHLHQQRIVKRRDYRARDRPSLHRAGCRIRPANGTYESCRSRARSRSPDLPS